MVRWHRSFLVQKDNKQDFRSRSGCSNMTLCRKRVVHTCDSKQMEENYVDTEGTSLMFETPGFQMLLSLLMICAVLGKTPAAKSTKFHRHLKWCVKILSVVTEVFIKSIFHGLPRKVSAIALSSFVSFKQHYPKRSSENPWYPETVYLPECKGARTGQ